MKWFNQSKHAFNMQLTVTSKLHLSSLECSSISWLFISIISEKDIDDNLMTSLGNSPPLDILIRTSGVKRLSDFLLWQVSLILCITSPLLSGIHLVLRGHPDSIHRHLLARLWPLRVHSHPPGLPTQGVVPKFMILPPS